MGELARLAVTERGEKRKILCKNPSRVILSEPSGESNFCGVPGEIPRGARPPMVGFDSQNTALWCFARSE